MRDPYYQDGADVLKNKLGIKDEKELDLAEAEQTRIKMMLMYAEGFSDFSTKGLCRIHKTLFEDIYDWAGKYRIINIIKREPELAGQSVWYSNDDRIDSDLRRIFRKINGTDWENMTKSAFVKETSERFAEIWQVHPFREGNTRTVVMMLTFFIEAHGYHSDKELLAKCAGYVRNAFVLASLGKYSEYIHLERILNDAISEINANEMTQNEHDEISVKYQAEKYKPGHHSIREPGYKSKYKPDETH